MNILVFDFGGTSVKYGVWSHQEIHETHSFPTPDDWESFTSFILKVKNDLGTKYALEGVAFSFPGAVDSMKGEIRGISPIPYTQHLPIKKRLSQLLSLPISIANDANCAALAELWMGVARDVQNALFVVIGTGIGGVVIFNRKIHYGKHLFGGEFGVALINSETPWTEVATAVHMARRYCRRLGLAEDSVSGQKVFELAKSGDDVAIGVVGDFYKNLSVGLFNLQTSFDPEMIIIGGGLSANNEVIENIKKHLDRLLLKYNFSEIKPEVKACKFKNSANLIGAVKHFFDEHGGCCDE